MCFPGGRVVKNLPANSGDTRDTGSIPGSERSPGSWPVDPLLHYSCLKNSMDRGAWDAAVHGSQRVGHCWAHTEQHGSRHLYSPWTRSLQNNKRTPRSKGLNFMGLPWWLGGKESTANAGDMGSIPRLGRFPGEENGNPHQYSCLGDAWTEESGGLQSMGHRVRHDLATKQQQQRFIRKCFCVHFLFLAISLKKWTLVSSSRNSG